jgi:hypothetical protein
MHSRARKVLMRRRANFSLHWTGSSRFSLLSMVTSLAAAPASELSVGQYSRMASKVQLVRMVAATLVALAACLFVSFYNWAFALTVERGRSLPAVTHYVVHFTPYAYSAPVVVFSLGILFLRGGREKTVAFESVIALAWLASFVWVLFTLWAWQITRIELVNHIR